jgi:hypothetical protein
MLFIIYYQNLKANFSLQKNLKNLSSLFTHSSKKKKEKRKKKKERKNKISSFINPFLLSSIH